MNVINNAINKLDRLIIEKTVHKNSIHDKQELSDALEEITTLEIVRELVVKYEKKVMSISN